MPRPGTGTCVVRCRSRACRPVGTRTLRARSPASKDTELRVLRQEVAVLQRQNPKRGWTGPTGQGLAKNSNSCNLAASASQTAGRCSRDLAGVNRSSIVPPQSGWSMSSQ